MKRPAPALPKGTTFGSWTVEYDHARKEGTEGVFVACVCACGTTRLIKRADLSSSKTTSCGCQRGRLVSIKKVKHGGSSTRLYRIWKGVKARCLRPTAQNFHHYGGRGITVCAEWKNSFSYFHEWAVTHGYADDLTIERNDVNADYCPENCRWISPAEQKNNTRVNNRVTAFGETKNITEWSNDPRCYVTDDTIRERLQRGMTEQKAIETPRLRTNSYTVDQRAKSA